MFLRQTLRDLRFMHLNHLKELDDTSPSIQTRWMAPIPELPPNLRLRLFVKNPPYVRQFYNYLDAEVVRRRLAVWFFLGRPLVRSPCQTYSLR